MPEPYAAVLLDLYDTIVWSEWFRLRDAIAERIGDDMEAVRLQKAFEETRPARGVGEFGSVEGDMTAVLRATGIPFDQALVGELVELERIHLENGVHLYDDALPVLAALRERGVRTALVSNCSHSTRPVVERLGLDEAFDHVILSYEARSMKPDPAIYLAALDGVGVPADLAVFVDDQPPYCEGGAVVGLDVRLILRANEDTPSDLMGVPVVTDLGWLL